MRFGVCSLTISRMTCFSMDRLFVFTILCFSQGIVESYNVDVLYKLLRALGQGGVQGLGLPAPPISQSVNGGIIGNVSGTANFENTKPDKSCFDFIFIMGRKLSEFPNINDLASNGDPVNVHIPGLVDRSLTLMKVLRTPESAKHLAKDFVYSLTQIILDGLSRCTYTKIHQGIVYGLAKSLDNFAVNHKEEICEKVKLFNTIAHNIPIEPNEVIQIITSELFEGLLKRIEDIGYKELVDDLENLEDELENEFKKQFVNRTELINLVNNSLKPQSIVCDGIPRLQNLFNNLDQALTERSNGIFTQDFEERLEGRLGNLLNDRQIELIAEEISRMSRGAVSSALDVFHAFVQKNITYLQTHNIIEPDQIEDARKLLELLSSTGISAAPSKRSVRKSELLEQILQELTKRKSSRRKSKQTQKAKPNKLIKPKKSNTANGCRECKSQSRRPAKIQDHPCFNFEVALNNVLGGFPDTTNPITKIELTTDDLESFIQKSLTIFRLMGEPDLVAQELVFSVTENILQQEKHCPASMFGRAVYYALARAFDNYELEEAVTQAGVDISIAADLPKIKEIVGELNHWVVIKLLTKVRTMEYAGTKHRMACLLRKVQRAMHRPSVTAQSLENVISRYNQTEWAECKTDVSVRRRLQKVKYILNKEIKRLNRTVEYRLRNESFSTNIKNEIIQTVVNVTAGFLIHVDELFKAILTRDEQYLTDVNTREEAILTKDQFDNLEIIFEMIGGTPLPSFVVPVTQDQLEQLIQIQDIVLNNGTLSDLTLMVSQRCQELKQLSNVHTPTVDRSTVDTFFTKCDDVNLLTVQTK